MFLALFYMFFFSSRRRHTRCLSDWSSDVCSSDLIELTGIFPRRCNDPGQLDLEVGNSVAVDIAADDRSEERRVGKEGRGRWWREDGRMRQQVERHRE